MSDQPWYVRAFVYVGLPTVAAGYLLWWVLGSQASQQAAHHEATLALTATIKTLTDELKTSHVEDVSQTRAALDQAWVQLSVMQRICLNTAKTDADRIACASLTGRGAQ